MTATRKIFDGVEPRTAALYARAVRRETHNSRSTATVIVLIIAILVVAWLGTETVLHWAGLTPLLVAPNEMVGWFVSGAADSEPLVVAIGVAALVLGIIVLIIAFVGGRRARHVLADSRIAVVADDRVLAASAARAARVEAGLGRDQARASVARRGVHVTLTPSSGYSIDEAAVTAAVAADVAAARVTPTLRAKTQVRSNGVVGA